MPKLGNVTTTKLTLPSGTTDDPAWVEIKNTLLLGDITDVDNTASTSEQAIVLLSRIISAWNFTDGDGNAVEPTVEWIKRLDVGDFTYLMKWVEEHLNDTMRGLTNSEKKTSLSPLTAAKEDEISPPTI